MRQKYCIFCGDSGLSKEHFWPDWLNKEVETKPTDKHTIRILAGNVKSPPDTSNENQRSGHVITKKFRVVCKQCNNGWMSELESLTKPILFSALNKADKVLSLEEVNNLSRWIVMKTMVAEQHLEESRVTPNSELKRFYETQVIPPYFRIYIGKHDTSEIATYHRASVLFGLSSHPVTDLETLERNTQTVSFIVGSIFVYVIACREQNYPIWKHLKLNQLKCLHPYTKKSLKLKSLKVIKQPQLADIVHSLEDYIQSNQVKNGGSIPVGNSI